jgi:UPF0755 protein
MVNIIIKFVFMMLCLISLVISGILYKGQQIIIPADKSITIRITPGDGVKQYLVHFKKNGYEISPIMFKIWGYWSKSLHKIQAGKHIIKGPVILKKLPGILSYKASIDSVRVSITEGLTRWHIADLLSQKNLVQREEFLRVVEQHQAEGMLFPDTYDFKTKISAKAIVQKLQKRFHKVWAQLIKSCESTKQCHPIYKNQSRAIILASFVERESVLEQERSMIAQVFYNRLALGMKLQSDPSCVYSNQSYREKPSPKTCHNPYSKYSTYIIKDLPPTAIANPGEASLKAILYPDKETKTKKYLFFVAKQDGSHAHIFNHSYHDHKKSIQHYLVK